MGIVGMVIAIITTLFNKNVLSYELIVIGIIIGGAIGTYIALKIEMTALPQLVAAFHSLVGLQQCLLQPVHFSRLTVTELSMKMVQYMFQV